MKKKLDINLLIITILTILVISLIFFGQVYTYEKNTNLNIIEQNVDKNKNLRLSNERKINL